MGTTTSSTFDLFGETVVTESAEKAARWAQAKAFIQLIGVFFPAFQLENVWLLPRAAILQRGRKTLPTYTEATKSLRSAAEVAAKTPAAKVLYISYVPADVGADSTRRNSYSGSRSHTAPPAAAAITANGGLSAQSRSSHSRSSSSSGGGNLEHARLWEQLYAAVAGFLSEHEEFAYVWVARSCLTGAGSAVAPGGVNYLNHVNPTALLVCDTVLIVPPEVPANHFTARNERAFSDLRGYTMYPWAALETILLHLAGAQGYVHFRHGDDVTYQNLASSNGNDSNGKSNVNGSNGHQARDIGAALCNCVAAAVESYGLSPSYEDCVRLNWEGAKLQNLLLSKARLDVMHFCEAGGALRQAICTLSVTQSQATEFMGVWGCLCDAQWFSPTPPNQIMAVLNLLTFCVAFFEQRIAPLRQSDYAESVLSESMEKMDGGGVHLDLWMKDLSPLDLQAVLTAAHATSQTAAASTLTSAFTSTLTSSLTSSLTSPVASPPKPKIRKLTVGSSHSGGAGLGAYLHCSPQLQELEVEWEGMRDVEHLSAALACNTTLTRLNLTHNSIGPGAGVRLALALKYNNSLKELDLRENMVGGIGMASIATAIKEHPSLDTLHMEDNGIGDEGAIAITEALCSSITLKWVYLDGNHITDQGGKVLAAAVSDSPSLQLLSLLRNLMGDVSKSALLNAWAERCTEESQQRQAAFLAAAQQRLNSISSKQQSPSSVWREASIAAAAAAAARSRSVSVARGDDCSGNGNSSNGGAGRGRMSMLMSDGTKPDAGVMVSPMQTSRWRRAGRARASSTTPPATPQRNGSGVTLSASNSVSSSSNSSPISSMRHGSSSSGTSSVPRLPPPPPPGHCFMARQVPTATGLIMDE